MTRALAGDDIVELYRLIDWLLELPPETEQDFRTEIIRYDQENIMPYVTSIERLAKAEGREEGLEKGLEKGREEGLEEGIEKGRRAALREVIKDTLLVRFGNLPEGLRERLEAESSLEKLHEIQRVAVTCGSLEALKWSE